MSAADDVVASITREEVVELALDICNIDSSVGHEAEVGERIFNWMKDEGFGARKIGLFEHRFSVLGTLPGTGDGYSLLFNSHMDTGVPREDDLTHIDWQKPLYRGAWTEGDLLVGEGICNDKGPMAAFMIAGHAIKRAGLKLRGDLLLGAVVAETAGEPIDIEPPGAYMETREVGSRFFATHGGIADYALIAEGTGFGLGWVEAGEFWFRIRVYSEAPPYYAPYQPERSEMVKSPNMLVASTAAIEAIENWAKDYQVSNTYKCPGGTIVPKALIGAIRSGNPHRPYYLPQYADLYLDVFTVPNQDPGSMKAELSEVIRKTGLPFTIDQYHYRPGYEAKNVGHFADAVTRAHRATFSEDPKPPHVETTSMWRDINVYNELGIPAITYGPRSTTHSYKRALTIESLYQAACVYARIAIEVCSEEKPATRIRKAR